MASALIAQFGFLVKSALKVRCTKFSYQTKVVTNQYPQLLCYVTFFDILHHYGVIAASQICSASRKYCAVLRNRFLKIILYFLLLIKLYLITKVRPQIFTNYYLLWSSIYLASHQDLSSFSFLFSCCLLTAQFYLDCLSLKQISQKIKQNFNSNTVMPTVK